jgi:LysM repeat protein
VSAGAAARMLAPAAFLAAVTIAVLVVRSGFAHDGGAVRSSADHVKRHAPSAQRAGKTAGSPGPRVSAAYYRIQRGDTLGAIAGHFGTSLEKLLALNPGIQPTALHIGQQVRIR